MATFLPEVAAFEPFASLVLPERSTAKRSKALMATGWSRSPRRQALSQGCSQIRLQIAAKGTFSRITATASAYLPSLMKRMKRGTSTIAGQAYLQRIEAAPREGH